MKQYIQYVVHNRRARIATIAIVAVIVFCVLFFSFKAQALDTKLEPTICEGDWNITEVSPKKDKAEEAKDSDELVVSYDDAQDNDDKEEKENIDENSKDTEEDIVDEEKLESIESIEDNESALNHAIATVENLIKETPIFSFFTDDVGSVTCRGFAIDDLPEKALPRSLNIVMTVSSPGGYEKDPSLVVEITQGIKNIFSDSEKNDSDSEAQTKDGEIISEEEISDTVSEESSSNDDADTTAETDEDVEAVDESAEPEGADQSEAESSSESESSESASSESPAAFFIRYAFAQEAESESSSESQQQSESESQSAQEAVEDESQEVTEEQISEDTTSSDETEIVSDSEAEVENSSSDSSESTNTESVGDSVVSVDTGFDETKVEIFKVDVSFDDGLTWVDAGVITLNMISKDPTEVAISVPINDPLFWTHIGKLQMRIIRGLSGESSEMDITIEHPHFALQYDDTAVMPDFTLNTIIDIKSMGDLTVFVLENIQTKERTLWIFQSTGSAQWTQLSETSGISPIVPIGLKSIYMFWVTADGNSVQGYDTSSQTVFGMTIDRNKAKLPFGSAGEVVVFKDNQLSFEYVNTSEELVSDNDPTLVDLFIKEYVDVAREMEKALQEAIILEPKEGSETQSVINENSIISAISDAKEDAEETLGPGETIVELSEAVEVDIPEQIIEVVAEDTEVEEIESVESVDIITESF